MFSVRGTRLCTRVWKSREIFTSRNKLKTVWIFKVPPPTITWWAVDAVVQLQFNQLTGTTWSCHKASGVAVERFPRRVVTMSHLTNISEVMAPPPPTRRRSHASCRCIMHCIETMHKTTVPSLGDGEATGRFANQELLSETRTPTAGGAGLVSQWHLKTKGAKRQKRAEKARQVN